MGKIKKIVVGSLSLISVGAAVCIAVPIIKNAVSNKADNPQTPVNPEIINNGGYNNVVKSLEDAIEIKLNNPIKEVQIESIKADESNMDFYTLVTINNATQSIVNYKLQYNNTEDIFTKYTDFISKDLEKVTTAEINTFWTDITAVTTYSNLVEIKGIKKVQNENITKLTSSIIGDYANSLSGIDENAKKQMNASINSYDNVELVESYFISRGFDRQSVQYLYDFNGIAFVDGYQAEIHTTVSSDNMITDTNELSALALDAYKKDTNNYNVTFSKANVLSYTMLNNTNKTNRTTTVEQEKEV